MNDPSEAPAKNYVGRLAPAPTGALHLGNARTFLLAWLRARRAGGKLVLRLEDLDHPKVKPGAAGEVYADLAWMGLDWDEGPAESFSGYAGKADKADNEDNEDNEDNGPTDQYVQSNRLPFYAGLLEDLRRRGLVYSCTCTRRELAAFASAPNAGEDLLETRYPGRCRGRYADASAARTESGTEPGWRLRVTDGAITAFADACAGEQQSVLSEWSGDFLIARGTRAGYQLAVVADDNAMNVTEVVRGADLLPSTHRQLALYKALGYVPPAFCHVPLVVGPDGRRLAKRHGDSRISLLRRAGWGPERLLGWAAWTAGWTERPREISLAEILEICDFTAMRPGTVVVGPREREWLGFAGLEGKDGKEK